MSEEDTKMDGVDETLKPEGEEANNEEESDDLDALLDSISKGDTSGDKPNDDSEKKDAEQPFLKKIGGKEFHSPEEYDKFVLKQHGDLSNAMGIIKKSSQQKTPETKQPEMDFEKIKWQLRSDEFFEKIPDANNFRQEMAAFLKTGRANDENGKPDLMKAYIMSKRAIGEDIPVVERTEDNLKNQKRIMRSGGGDSGSGEVFADKSEMEDLSNFADAAVLKKV